MPNNHEAAEQETHQYWYPTSIRNLGEVGSKEKDVHNEKDKERQDFPNSQFPDESHHRHVEASCQNHDTAHCNTVSISNTRYVF